MNTEETQCYYLVAKPKFGRRKAVFKSFMDMAGLFAEVYDRRANCNFRLDLDRGNELAVRIIFENNETKAMLEPHPKYNELFLDLKVNSRSFKILLPKSTEA
jgi:hypothetical protein